MLSLHFFSLGTFSRDTNIAQKFSVASNQNQNQIPNQPQSYNNSSHMNLILILRNFLSQYNKYPPCWVVNDIYIEAISLIKYVSLEVAESKCLKPNYIHTSLITFRAGTKLLDGQQISKCIEPCQAVYLRSACNLNHIHLKLK